MPDTSAKMSPGATLDVLFEEPDSLVRSASVDGSVIYVLDQTDHGRMIQLLTRVNERYDIPDRCEPDVADLVKRYIRRYNSLNASIDQWQKGRGTKGWDLEFEAEYEGMLVSSLAGFAREFSEVCKDLASYLESFPVKARSKQMPGWLKEAADREAQLRHVE